MKRIITLILGCSLFLSSFTACKESEREDNDLKGNITSEKQTLIDLGDEIRAYIPVNRAFFTVGGDDYSPDGNAYNDVINDTEFSAEVKLQMTNTLYFDGMDFTQFKRLDFNEENITNYAGNYNVGNDGKVNLKYIRYHSYNDDNEELYFDLETEQTNMNYGRKLVTIVDGMLEANDNGSFFDLPFPRFSWNDKYPYIYGCFYNQIKESGDNWVYLWINEDLNTELYSIDNYLVAEQKGYSFTGTVSQDEFTLKYDVSDFNENRPQIQMDFRSDNTWVSDLKSSYSGNDGHSGKWEMFDEHCLIIFPPEDDEYYSPKDITVFYLDFENKNIYVPFYIRCDDMIKIAEEYENIKN